jgi:hypothetical protein
MIEPWGRFTVHFSATNNRGIGREEDKIIWHDKKREKMTFNSLSAKSVLAGEKPVATYSIST